MKIIKKKRMLKLLEEAGFSLWEDEPWKPEGATVCWDCDYDKEIRKYTKLVVKEVIIEFAKSVEAKLKAQTEISSYFDQILEEIRIDEREACAKVCDRFIGTTMVCQAERIQSAIRARGVNTSPEHVDELKECVHEFFTKYLNHVEESDSGREFNPVTIGCCRALMLGPLNQLLERMRVLSGAGRNPLSTDGIDGARVGEVGIWGEK